SHLEHQLEVFPELDARKAHVVPNGWEPEDFTSCNRADHSDTCKEVRPLRMAHVGNLAGHTSPNDFFQSLQQLLTDEPKWRNGIRLQLTGQRTFDVDKAIRAFSYPDILEVSDHVGKREASRRMQESDVLLLISRPDLSRYLPGKLFDYLAARRPILVFGERGEASALVEQLGVGVRCPAGSGAMLRDALVRLRELDMASNEDTVTA